MGDTLLWQVGQVFGSLGAKGFDLKLLELFSGQGSISATFKERGHQAYRVDWSDDVEAELHADIGTLTIKDVVRLCDGIPDVIWASPQCTTYSIATHLHRTLAEGLKPKTETAAQDDRINIAMWTLIDQLIEAGTTYYFVENPRGRMRHMPFVQNRLRYTLSYCSYGRRGNAKGWEHTFTNKPTDIWTNHTWPRFEPLCTKSRPGHIHGNTMYAVKRDYLSRGEIPKDLREHLVDICE
jgi:site-specific DNA-cytosine methylase